MELTLEHFETSDINTFMKGPIDCMHVIEKTGDLLHA